MSEILSIAKLTEMANPVISIPNFDGTGTINVRVRKPSIMSMAAKGQIPNHLLGIATETMTGKPSSKQKPKEPDAIEKLQRITDTYELYAQVCLVEPTYEEFKEIMTDEQKLAILNWAMGDLSALDSFRKNEGNGSGNNNGEEVSKEAK